MALFGLLYKLHINLQIDASRNNNEDEELPLYVYYTGDICTYLRYLVIGANIIVVVNVLIYFVDKFINVDGHIACTLIAYILNGAAIILFAVAISMICIHFKGIKNSKSRY